MKRTPTSVSFEFDVLKKLDVLAKEKKTSRSHLVNDIVREVIFGKVVKK